MYVIDGAFGEGGGQIVRTAVTLSCITKKPITIKNIRHNRRKPGLSAQHLTAIKLVAKMCNAKTKGLRIGSDVVEFIPDEMEDKVLSEDVGTAGSISLILSVLVPATAFCKRKLKLSIKGGTDVPWSPTIQYLNNVLGEAYSRMGINFSMTVKERGYYPKGGGLVDILVSPCRSPKPIVLSKRETKNVEVFCSFSKIPKKEITNEIKDLVNDLEGNGFEVRSSISSEDAKDEGVSVLVMCKDSGSIIGVDTISRGKLNIYQKFADITCIDEHLSDMLVVPASLIDDTTIFNVNKISSHLETNLYVASMMTGSKYSIKKNGCYKVRIVGSNPSV